MSLRAAVLDGELKMQDKTIRRRFSPNKPCGDPLQLRASLPPALAVRRRSRPGGVAAPLVAKPEETVFSITIWRGGFQTRGHHPGEPFGQFATDLRVLWEALKYVCHASSQPSAYNLSLVAQSMDTRLD